MSKEIISTNNAPKAIGPYSQAVKTGDLIFISGQIPLNPKTGDLVSGSIGDEANQVLENPVERKHIATQKPISTIMFKTYMSSYES